MFWLWVLSITAELEQEQEKQGEKITSERNALAEHWAGFMPLDFHASLLLSQTLSFSLLGSHSLFPFILNVCLVVVFTHPFTKSVRFSLSAPWLFLAKSSSGNTVLCNNVWCCFRDALSARGGGVSWLGYSDEEPVHRQRHAHSATRGRPCQQVSFVVVVIVVVFLPHSGMVTDYSEGNIVYKALWNSFFSHFI